MHRRISSLRKSDILGEGSMLNDDSEIDWTSTDRRETDWWRHLGNQSGSRFFPTNMQHTKVDDTVIVEDSYISFKLQEVYELAEEEDMTMESLSDLSRTSGTFAKPKGLFKSNAKKLSRRSLRPDLPNSNAGSSLKTHRNEIDSLYQPNEYSFEKSISFQNNSSLDKPKSLFKSNVSMKKVDFGNLLNASKEVSADTSSYLEDVDLDTSGKPKKSLFANSKPNLSLNAATFSEINKSDEDVENCLSVSNNLDVSNSPFSKKNLREGLKSQTIEKEPPNSSSRDKFAQLNGELNISNVTLESIHTLNNLRKTRHNLFKSSNTQRMSKMFAGAVSVTESNGSYSSDDENEHHTSNVLSQSNKNVTTLSDNTLANKSTLHKEDGPNKMLFKSSNNQRKSKIFAEAVSVNESNGSHCSDDENEHHSSNILSQSNKNVTTLSDNTLANKSTLHKEDRPNKMLFKSSNNQRKSKIFAEAVSVNESNGSHCSDDENEHHSSNILSQSNKNVTTLSDNTLANKSTLHKEDRPNKMLFKSSNNQRKSKIFAEAVSVNESNGSHSSDETAHHIQSNRNVTTLTDYTLANKSTLLKEDRPNKILFKSSNGQRKSKLFAGAISLTESNCSFESDNSKEWENESAHLRRKNMKYVENNEMIKDGELEREEDILHDGQTDVANVSLSTSISISTGVQEDVEENLIVYESFQRKRYNTRRSAGLVENISSYRAPENTAEESHNSMLINIPNNKAENVVPEKSHDSTSIDIPDNRAEEIVTEKSHNSMLIHIPNNQAEEIVTEKSHDSTSIYIPDNRAEEIVTEKSHNSMLINIPNNQAENIVPEKSHDSTSIDIPDNRAEEIVTEKSHNSMSIHIPNNQAEEIVTEKSHDSTLSDIPDNQAEESETEKSQNFMLFNIQDNLAEKSLTEKSQVSAFNNSNNQAEGNTMFDISKKQSEENVTEKSGSLIDNRNNQVEESLSEKCQSSLLFNIPSNKIDVSGGAGDGTVSHSLGENSQSINDDSKRKAESYAMFHVSKQIQPHETIGDESTLPGSTMEDEEDTGNDSQQVDTIEEDNSAQSNKDEKDEDGTDNDSIVLNLSDHHMDDVLMNHSAVQSLTVDEDADLTEPPVRRGRVMEMYSTFKKTKPKVVHLDPETNERMKAEFLEKVARDAEFINRKAEEEVAQLLNVSVPLRKPLLMRETDEILASAFNKTSGQIQETKCSKNRAIGAEKGFARKSIDRSVRRRNKLGNIKRKSKKLYMKELWITRRLYNFIQSKLKPKYGLMCVRESETFIKYLANVIGKVEKSEGGEQHTMVQELKVHMANMSVIRTHRDFVNFVDSYLPRTFRIKSIPAPGREVPELRAKLDDPVLKVKKK